MPIPKMIASFLTPLRWPDETVDHLVSVVSLVDTSNQPLIDIGTTARMLSFDKDFLVIVKTEEGKVFKTYPHYFARVREDFIKTHNQKE